MQHMFHLESSGINTVPDKTQTFAFHYHNVQQTVCHVLNQFLYHFCVHYTLVTTHIGPLKSSWVCLILKASTCGLWLVCSLSCFLVGLCFQGPVSTIRSPISARCWVPLHYSCSTMLTKAVGSSTSSLDSGHSRYNNLYKYSVVRLYSLQCRTVFFCTLCIA